MFRVAPSVVNKSYLLNTEQAIDRNHNLSLHYICKQFCHIDWFYFLYSFVRAHFTSLIMAKGSQLYTQYYLIQFLVYLIVGVMGIAIFISIAPQCKPICPVASENDLALNGYDRKNVMYGMKATADATPSGYDGVPEEYTYYYSCNMSEALGSPNWWNGTGEAAVRNVWEVAVTQSAKSEFLAAKFISSGKTNPLDYGIIATMQENYFKQR